MIDWNALSDDHWQSLDCGSSISLRAPLTPGFVPNIISGSHDDMRPIGTPIACALRDNSRWCWAVAVVAGVEVLELSVHSDDEVASFRASVIDYSKLLPEFLRAIIAPDAPQELEAVIHRSTSQVVVARPQEIKVLYTTAENDQGVIAHADGTVALRPPVAGLAGLLPKLGFVPTMPRPSEFATKAKGRGLEICRFASQEHHAACLAVSWLSPDAQTHSGGLICTWTDGYELFALEGTAYPTTGAPAADADAEHMDVDPGVFWAQRMSAASPMSVA